MFEILDTTASDAIQAALKRLGDAGAGPNERMFALVRMNRAARNRGGAVRMELGRGVVADIPAHRETSGWWIVPPREGEPDER